MNDNEKIARLRSLGVWDTLDFCPVTPDLCCVYYEIWEGDTKTVRMTFDFKPHILLRSEPHNIDFLSRILDCVADVQERFAPDIPGKIPMIKPPSV